MAKPRLWRYIAGERGVNRIRVYERRPGGPLSVEWYDRDGRHQKTLTKLAGVPLMGKFEEDKELAKELAERMAAAQRKKRDQQKLHALAGLPVQHTLGELLTEYHNAHPDWSPGHKRSQESSRRYWLDRLGEDSALSSISPALAQNTVANDAARLDEGFGKRTQQKRIRYIKEAFNYARKHLKWITEMDDLTALETPTVQSESKPYTLEEVRKLLPATEEVDLRCAAAAYLSAISGRRAGAIRRLTVNAYSIEQYNGEEVGVIQFPGATDKARRSGRVYVVGRAKEVVEALLNTPAVKSSGLMFVTGDLNRLHPSKRTISERTLRNWLEKAEEIAGVEHIPGRAYHGFKRRYATEALRMDPHAASKQSGTNLQTLQEWYLQDDPEVKIALARGLERTILGS